MSGKQLNVNFNLFLSLHSYVIKHDLIAQKIALVCKEWIWLRLAGKKRRNPQPVYIKLNPKPINSTCDSLVHL